jgi:hypothetical protein
VPCYWLSDEAGLIPDTKVRIARGHIAGRRSSSTRFAWAIVAILDATNSTGHRRNPNPTMPYLCACRATDWGVYFRRRGIQPKRCAFRRVLAETSAGLLCSTSILGHSDHISLVKHKSS